MRSRRPGPPRGRAVRPGGDAGGGARRARPFDVVHLHEPLAPSPALAALRHAPRRHGRDVPPGRAARGRGLPAAAGRPRPGARRPARRHDRGRRADALSEILPGDYTVIRPGRGHRALSRRPARPRGPPGLVLVARGRDRVGVRFARERAARPRPGRGRAGDPARARPTRPGARARRCPKALRGRVTVVPDAGPALARDRARGRAHRPDRRRPRTRRARRWPRRGRRLRGARPPRRGAPTRPSSHGADALVLPPFTRDAWSRTVTELVADPARRAALGAAARARASARTWDRRPGSWRRPTATPSRAARDGAGTPCARRPARASRPGLDARADRGRLRRARDRRRGGRRRRRPVGRRATAAAPPAGADRDGGPGGRRPPTAPWSGSCSPSPSPTGLSPADAAAAIHAQGGLVLAPHTGRRRRRRCARWAAR